MSSAALRLVLLVLIVPALPVAAAVDHERDGEALSARSLEAGLTCMTELRLASHPSLVDLFRRCMDDVRDADELEYLLEELSGALPPSADEQPHLLYARWFVLRELARYADANLVLAEVQSLYPSHKILVAFYYDVAVQLTKAQRYDDAIAVIDVLLALEHDEHRTPLAARLRSHLTSHPGARQ